MPPGAGYVVSSIMQPEALQSVRALRILLVSEDIPGVAMGGLAKHVFALANALAEAGHIVDLMGNNTADPDDVSLSLSLPGKFFGDLTGAHVGWKESTLGCFMPPRRALVARRFARSIMRRAPGYEVIHYHGHVPDVAAFIPRDINFLQTRHDQGADCLVHTRFKGGAICNEIIPERCAECITTHPNPVQKWISEMAVSQYRRRVALGMQRHKTVFVSDMLRRNLARTFGGHGSDWGQVIHNFIDWRSLQRHMPHPPRRSEGAKVTVLIASKLYPPKGVKEFLESFAQQVPANMHILIAGDGPDTQGLKAKYSSESVQFLGWCDHSTVLERTALANAIVVPSTWEEPCATTVLEGLALGCKVFALDRGGTPELLRFQNYTGQLMLFSTMAELACALAQFSPSETRSPPVAQSADVRLRLPELLAAYRQRLQPAL